MLGGGALHSISVSDTNRVVFAPGNLQYRASDDTWRFALHQYDFVGGTGQRYENGVLVTVTDGNVYENNIRCTHSSMSATYSGWIDLFGWGTSGYNSKYPYEWINDYNYYHYGSDIADTDYDWGVYSPIRTALNSSLPAEKQGNWRTPTSSEWDYLIASRRASTIDGVPNARYTLATVNTDGSPVKGMIIFPDNYAGGNPTGVTWGTINAPSNYTTSCTSAGWVSLEEAGCVFLPAAGGRFQRTVNNLQTFGDYASTTYYGTMQVSGTQVPCVYVFVFNDSNAITSAIEVWNYLGYPVRLVKDI